MGKENQTRPKRLAAMLVMIIAVVLAAGISCHRTWNRLGNRETPEESQPVLLRLAETMPEEHPSARASALFAQLVDERSNGRVKIRVYYNSELGSPDEVMEQLKFGGVGLARVSSLELSDLDSGLREQMMPARFASRDQQMEWFWEHQEELKQLCEKDNMVPLVWYYPDRRCFYSSRMDIADASSLEGKKVQTASCKLMSDLMRQWKAESVGYMSIDAFTFFNSGSIDCAESAFGEFICCNYVPYSRYVTINDDLYFPDVLLINSDSLKTLSQEDQELLAVCAEATYEYQKLQMEALSEQWEPELKKSAGIQWKEGNFR